VPERGRCLLGAGRCLLALDRPSAAMTLLRDARHVFLGLAAEPLVAESDVLLERATALTS